jgi:hypothetical protein
MMQESKCYICEQLAARHRLTEVLKIFPTTGHLILRYAIWALSMNTDSSNRQCFDFENGEPRVERTQRSGLGSGRSAPARNSPCLGDHFRHLAVSSTLALHERILHQAAGILCFSLAA